MSLRENRPLWEGEKGWPGFGKHTARTSPCDQFPNPEADGGGFSCTPKGSIPPVKSAGGLLVVFST